MTISLFRLFAGSCLIPHDDTSRDAADDRLASDLADALAAVPVADAGHRVRLDQQQGDRSCS